jgi:AraC-like DNA-binding protein
MDNTLTIHSIAQGHQVLGLPKPKHPLVSVVKASEVRPTVDLTGVRVVSELYQILYKQTGSGALAYGRNSYDYEEGTLVFIAPGQVVGYDDGAGEGGEVWTLAFHPDLIRKSELGKQFGRYSFFDYEVNEALHLSEEEKKTILEILEKIVKEYSQNLDRHSQHLINANIQLLLDYCLRFYDRQFYTRTNLNSDVVSRFERLLRSYYQADRAAERGIPSVGYLAAELHLSPNYLSDLLKKETGKTTQEHIHLYLIEQAKSSLLHSSLSISEIGYALGFEYPQHFSNLFKAKTGMSPRAYRSVGGG